MSFSTVRTDYLIELHQMHPIFTQWANNEPELESILMAIAKAIEYNAVAHQNLLDTVTNEEREYIAYIDSVKDALSRRDTMQIEYELTVEELSKRRLEKDQVNSKRFLFLLKTRRLNCTKSPKNLNIFVL